VLDAQDDDFARVFADPVEHPVGTAPSGPDSLEIIAEGFADTLRVVKEGRGHELDDGGRDRFG